MVRAPAPFGGRDLVCVAALLGLTGLAFHQILLPLAGPQYSLGGDVAWYFYPVRLYTLSELAHGTFPFWTPHVAFGFPLYADIEAAVFYFPSLLMGLLFGSGVWALELQLILYVALGGVGMYGLLRHLGSSVLAALFAGAAWLLSGVLWAHSLHVSIIQSAAWLPLVLWTFDQCLARGKIRWAALSGALLALVFLGGHPQIWAYVVIALAVWGGVHARPITRNGPGLGRMLGFFALTMFTALGLAALQLIPAAELSRVSVRYHVSETFLFEDALPPDHLLTLLLPLAFHGTGGWRSVDEFHAYMGVTPLLLAGAALIRGRGPRIMTAAILLLLSIPLALGLYRPLVGWVPGLEYFRVPARALLLFDFAVAFLAGLGVDVVARGERSGLLRAFVVIGLLLGISAWAVLGVWKPSLPALSPTLTSQVGRFVLIFLASAVIMIAALRQPGVSWPALLLIGLVAVDQVSIPRTLMWSRTPAEGFWPETPVITRLRSDSGLFRVWTDGVLYGRGRVREANLGLVHRIQTTDFYSSLVLARPSRFLDHFGERLLEFPHLLDLLNIKYVVTSRDPRISLPNSLREGEARYEQLAPTLWLNLSALPRAFVVGEVEVVRAEAALLQRLETLDPRRRVLIERSRRECSPLEGQRSLDSSEVGAARIVEYASTRIYLEAELRRPGALVVTDTYYPGWTVRVNGREAPLLRGDFLFRAVCLSAGRHQVEMRYEPRAFWAGLVITLATLGGLGAGGMLSWRRKTRSRPRDAM